MNERFNDALNRALRGAMLRETVRRRSQRRTVSESRKPQEGPYYWIPMPGGEWELMSWYVSDLGVDHSDHVKVWKDYAAPYIADVWGVPLSDVVRIPYSVPRGRVSKGAGAVYINHGGDSPVGHDRFVNMVCREFNLTGVLVRTPEKVKVSLDNHERTQSRDVAALKAILSASHLQPA